MAWLELSLRYSHPSTWIPLSTVSCKSCPLILLPCLYSSSCHCVKLSCNWSVSLSPFPVSICVSLLGSRLLYRAAHASLHLHVDSSHQLLLSPAKPTFFLIPLLLLSISSACGPCLTSCCLFECDVLICNGTLFAPPLLPATKSNFRFKFTLFSVWMHVVFTSGLITSFHHVCGGGTAH